jgi:protein-S-isoprenylcysteine O-methyltransferase Ste14
MFEGTDIKLSFTQKLFITALAVVFTVGLTFASLELPNVVDSFLQESFRFPGFDHGLTEFNLSKTELYIQHFHLRLIGYVCLFVVIGLIIVGFITDRTGLSTVGAVALFLPAFGSFALSMFFLAGLGFLRVLWMPLTDVSPLVMKLGDVVYAPYDLVIYVGSLFKVYPRVPFITICIGVGLFLFVSGILAWFYTRFRKHNVADFFVYRICRHPQYLGWIIWSYGIFLIRNEHFKKTWSYPDSLPWLLSTVIIIGVALVEELSMRRRFGEEYESFRCRTHFMFPLPSVLKRALALPARFLLRIKRVEKKRHVFAILFLYTAILVGVSYIYADSSSVHIKLSSSSKTERVDELVRILKLADGRRWKHFASLDLVQYGDLAVDPLIELTGDADPVVRDYAIQTLIQLRAEKAIPAFMAALNDENSGVRYDAAHALGELGVKEAEDGLIGLLSDERGSVRSSAARALVKLGSRKAVGPIIEGLDEEEKYPLCSKIDALGRLGAEEAVPWLILYLEHDEAMVRQAAAVSLANIRSPLAKDALTEALDDDDWQVRVYAAEALKMVKERKRR